MEVTRGVLLVGRIGLVRPVDPDLLMPSKQPFVDQEFRRSYRLMDTPAIQRLHGTLCRAGVIILDETVVVALGLFGS